MEMRGLGYEFDIWADNGEGWHGSMGDLLDGCQERFIGRR